MYIALPFTNTSVGATLSVFSNIARQAAFTGGSVSGSNSTIGINDIFAQPLWLDWRGKYYDVAAGYSQWQVQDNHGADQPGFLNSNNQIHDVCRQIGGAVPKINAQVNFHYFTGFDAQARLQGDYAGLTVAVGF